MVSGQKKPRKYSQSQQEKRAQRRNKHFERRGRILDDKEAAIRRRQADFERSVHKFENNAVRDARRKMVQFAEQAHVAGIERGQAERKAREFKGDVERTEEELHMLQRKLVRVARQREAIHHHARHMFMAAAHVVRKPDDGARQDALAACAQALRHMHQQAVFVHHGPGGRMPPPDGIW